MGSPFRNVQKLKFEKANRERYDKMPQKTKDSLQGEAWKYGGPFWSPKHQVNVDPEDGVLYNRPIYKDGTMLTYPSLSKPTSRETELNKPPTNRLSIKRETSKINESSRGMKALKTAYDVGSTFLKGGLGVASTMLTPATAYAQGQPMPEFIEGGVDNRSLEEFERDGPIPLPKFKEETPLNKAEPRRTIGKGKNFNKVSEDKSATGGAAGGGMTQKGVNEYKKENPGSNLQTAVTEKPSELKPGSKKAKRRKSFCARSKGWTSERGRAARRRWNC